MCVCGTVRPAPAHPELLPANSSAERFLDDSLGGDSDEAGGGEATRQVETTAGERGPELQWPSVFFSIPAIGWAPKDRAAHCGFSVEKYGAQDEVDAGRPDCGSGTHNGVDITAAPTDTSRQVGPEYISGFLERLKSTRPDSVVGHPERTANPDPRVVIAIDNEPDLWYAQ